MVVCILRQFSNILTHLQTYILHELADDVCQLCSHYFPVTGTLLRLAGGSGGHHCGVAMGGCFSFLTNMFLIQSKARLKHTE